MATSDDPEQRAWNAMVPPGRPGERGCEIYLRPHPEERAFARVSKDGRESALCVHPSRRLLRKLLRMRSEIYSQPRSPGPTPCRQMLCTVLVADVSMKEMPVVMHPGVRRDDPRRGGAQITIASSLVPITSQVQVPALMLARPLPY